jgi:glutamyl-tRNA reductase
MAGATAPDTPAGARARLTEQLDQERDGSVLLATCHRVELYGWGGPRPTGLPITRAGEDAARHLFRVAAGLESAAAGEDQVLHQVRQALIASDDVDPGLRRLFEDAIATGRRVRAMQPAPAHGLEEPAVGWLAERTQLSSGFVLVAGAGTLGKALIRTLRERGATVVAASRSRRPEAELDLAAAARLAPRAKAIAVALGGPWHDLTPVDPSTLPPIVDLSAPAAVPEPVRAALGDRSLGIDDITAEPAAGAWRAAAEELVEEGLQGHRAWLGGRGSAGLVRALRERAEARRQDRVDRYLRGRTDLDAGDAERVQLLTRRIVGDLLHEPLAALRSDPDGTRAEAARWLFDL